MNLKQMRHVVAVAESRNFVRAAERVRLSQPALSRSVQAAEALLGFALFDRGGAEVTVTPAGAFVIERARELLFGLRCFERDVDLFRSRQIGRLAIGAGPFAAAVILPQILPRLRREHPGIELRVEVNQWPYLTEHLRNEALDFYIASTADVAPQPFLEVEPLARYPGHFYVRSGHPLLERESVAAKDMLEFGFATVNMPQKIRLFLMERLGIDPCGQLPVALECNDVGLLKQVALESDTVLASVDVGVAAEARGGALVRLPLADIPTLTAELGAVYLKWRSHSPIAALVLDRIRAIARELAGYGSADSGTSC